MAPEKRPQLTKLEQMAKSAGALILSRFATFALVPLVMIVWSSVQSGINEGKMAAEGARTAAAAAFSQVNQLAVLIASLTSELQGEQRAQAIINAAREYAQADHETRIRLLEAWQRNVLNRNDPG